MSSSADSVRSYEVHVESVQGLMAVLRWQNPVKSATAFAESLIFLFIIQNGNILRFILQLGYLIIGITALTEFITKFLNGGRAGLVSSFKPSRLILINKERLQEHSDSLVAIGEELLYWIRRVLDARDLKLTLTAFFLTWILYAVTAIAPFSSLATTAVILAFTVPAIYTRFQTELEHARGHFSNIINNKYAEVQDQVNIKAGPQLEKIRAARQTIGGVFGYTQGNSSPAAPAPSPSGDVAAAAVAGVAVGAGAAVAASESASSSPAASVHSATPTPSIHSAAPSASVHGASPVASSTASIAPSGASMASLGTSGSPASEYSQSSVGAPESVVSEIASVSSVGAGSAPSTIKV